MWGCDFGLRDAAVVIVLPDPTDDRDLCYGRSSTKRYMIFRVFTAILVLLEHFHK